MASKSTSFFPKTTDVFLIIISLFFLFILFTGRLNAQTTVTIGAGASGQTYPFDSYDNGYIRSAAIYTSAEVTTFGTILTLGWNVGTTTTVNCPYKIYLKTTTSSTLTSDTWANLISGATLVYDATRNFSSSGWTTIDISDFDYSANNLLVLCESNYGGTGGASPAPKFKYTAAASKHEYVYSNGSPPSGSGTVTNNRPNIQITICSIVGGTATPAASPIVSGSSTTISCTGYTSSGTTLQWEESNDGSTGWANASGGSGATTSAYTTAALTSSKYFRMKVTSGSCVVYSTVAYVQVGTPLSITSPTSASISFTSAVLGGNITSTGSSNVTERGIYYNTNNGFADGAGTKVSETPGPYTPGTFTEAVTGLSPNTTYYYKAFAKNSSGTVYTSQGTFTTLFNDECANAITIPVNTSCSYSTYSNAGATSSYPSSMYPACGSGSSLDYYKDIWFKFTVPSSGNTRISTKEGTLTDCAMELYSGSCGSLTAISCNDNYVTGYNQMPFIDLMGRTPGEVIYVRFWDVCNDGTSGNCDEGNFGICAYDLTIQPSCNTNPAASDICGGAPLIANLNGYCGNTSASYTPDQPGNLASVFCGSIENNSWLSFVASSTTAQFNIYVDNCYSSSHAWSYPTSGIQIRIYGTSDCSTFTAYSDCWFPGVPTDGFLTATGLTPGSTYYMMIDGTFGDNCDYTIGASEGILLPIELASFNARCDNDRIKINWTTSSETNNDFFTVERSADGINFDPILILDGAGNSNSLLNYKAYDNSPITGVSYYRLKQTDFDGMYTLSNIVAVNPCQALNQKDIVISPNPFSDYFIVDISKLNAEKVNIQIEDLLGKVVWEYSNIPSDSSNVHVSLSNTLESGYYILKIKYDDNVITKKILKYKD